MHHLLFSHKHTHTPAATPVGDYPCCILYVHVSKGLEDPSHFISLTLSSFLELSQMKPDGAVLVYSDTIYRIINNKSSATPEFTQSVTQTEERTSTELIWVFKGDMLRIHKIHRGFQRGRVFLFTRWAPSETSSCRGVRVCVRGTIARQLSRELGVGDMRRHRRPETKLPKRAHPTVFPQPHQASPQSRICEGASMAWNEIDSCSRPWGCQNGAGANYLGFTGLTILSSSRETSLKPEVKDL